MGVGSSSMPPQTATVVFDMYNGGRGGCDSSNQCSTPSFEHVQYVQGMEAMMSQVDFMNFKQRVCGVTQNYRATHMQAIIPFIIFLVIIPSVASAVLGIPGYQMPFIFAAVGGLFYFRSRTVNHNNLVDTQVRAICAEFNSSCLAGRATLTLMTQHTGFCVPKHARVMRQVWLSSATNSQTQHQHDQNYAVGSTPAQPQTMMMTPAQASAGATAAAVPGYPQMMPGGQATMAYPMGEQPPPPPPPPLNYNYNVNYNTSAYPPPPPPHNDNYNTSAYPPLPPHDHNYTAPASYPPPPTAASAPPAAQREVFYAKVPKGVEGGQTFETKTPSGRTVTVSAPAGTREGMEFQTYA